jgi:rhomboid protease GluP
VIEQQDFEFLQAFWARRSVIAYSVFALNIIIFGLMTLAGGSENFPTLIAFGAKSNALIDNGEIWRFVTPIFLHIGLLHLFFNSYALWVIGPQVEKLYGGPRFLLLYLLTGIGGVAASYWYHPPIPSAGASGSIFGLFGVLLVFSIKYRRVVPAFFSRALGKGILLTVGINLVIGYMIPQIDNAAHLGGLLSGCLLGAIVPFARPGEPERQVFKVAQAIGVLVIGVSFFEVATHYTGPAPSLSNFNRSLKRGDTTTQFLTAINKGQSAFENSEVVLESGDLQRLPEVQKELTEAIDAMAEIPSYGAQADSLSSELTDLLRKQYEYVQEVQRTGRVRSDFIGTSPQSRSFRAFSKRLDEWVDREGANYGIQRTK